MRDDGDDDDEANFLREFWDVATTDDDGEKRRGESCLLCMNALAAGADEIKARIILLTRIVELLFRSGGCFVMLEESVVSGKCKIASIARMIIEK